MTDKNKKAIMEWLKDFVTVDTQEVYSNGTEYVPLYRVEQALDLLDEESGKIKEFITC